MIPKMIGFYLINTVMSGIQFKVYQKVSKSSSFKNLTESPSIVTRRNTLRNMLEILSDSRKILLRDPALSYSLDAAKSMEYQLINEKKRRATNIANSISTGFKAVGNSIASGAGKVKDMFKSSKPDEENQSIP